MAVVLQIKRKSGSNPTNLVTGELALRLDTGELFTYDGSAIVKIGSKNMLTTAGGVMSGYLTLHDNPTQDYHAATKQYVDTNVGAGGKTSVRVATTGNITLSGTQSIDGVNVVSGDRVLVKDQTNQTQNGVYVVASGSWTRANDFASGTARWGAFYFVETGTTNKGRGYVASSPADLSGLINIGTDSIQFVRFSEWGMIAGNGIDISGVTISAREHTGISVTVNGISVIYGTTAGTACQGNDSRLHTQNTDTGTSNATFQIGSGGLRLKTVSSVLQVRTSDDSQHAPMSALSMRIVNNINAFASIISGTVTGSDKTLTIPDSSGTLLHDNSIIDGGTW